MPAAAPAQNVPKLVPDVSQRQIDIQSGFHRRRAAAVRRDHLPARGCARRADRRRRRPARPCPPDNLARKAKDCRHLDQRRQQRLPLGPGLLCHRSSRPLDTIVDSKTAAIYELGLDKLQLSPSGEVDAREQRRFVSNGLVDLKQRNGLFRQEAGSVNITDQVLYRARLYVPSSVPVGTYTAETLLIRDGRVIVADDNVEVRVRKTGFEQLVTILAQDYSLFYGAMAVLVSLLLGWFAGYIFQRF